MVEYLIDSNSLIDAHTRWYEPVIFQKIWDFIEQSPNVEMTTFVYNEIIFPDALVNWKNRVYRSRQVQTDDLIIKEYQHVMTWIRNSNRWGNAGIIQWEDVDKADPWLIATAMAYDQTIVTMDGGNRNTSNLPNVGSDSKREPKISAVANELNVRTIPMYELLKEMQIKI